jgi:hypothetical protein
MTEPLTDKEIAYDEAWLANFDATADFSVEYLADQYRRALAMIRQRTQERDALRDALEAPVGADSQTHREERT